MKKIIVPITVATLYAVFFQCAILFGMSDGVVFTLFFFSPFLVLGLAYIILKDGQPSQHRFDERFYDDWSYRRNGSEEISDSLSDELTNS